MSPSSAISGNGSRGSFPTFVLVLYLSRGPMPLEVGSSTDELLDSPNLPSQNVPRPGQRPPATMKQTRGTASASRPFRTVSDTTTLCMQIPDWSCLPWSSHKNVLSHYDLVIRTTDFFLPKLSFVGQISLQRGL